MPMIKSTTVEICCFRYDCYEKVVVFGKNLHL